MKRFLVLMCACFFAVGFAQDAIDKLEPPAPGKAVVYFFRTGNVGLARPFHFFVGNEYLGVVKGKNYIRYECDPGEQLLWASAENKTFMTADLEAGRIYGVLSVSKVGFGSARVKMLIMKPGEEGWAKAAKLIKKKDPFEQKPGYIEDWKAKKPDYTKQVLADWESTYKDERDWPSMGKGDYIK